MGELANFRVEMSHEKTTLIAVIPYFTRVVGKDGLDPVQVSAAATGSRKRHHTHFIDPFALPPLISEGITTCIVIPICLSR